jgi:hypothetical protein
MSGSSLIGILTKQSLNFTAYLANPSFKNRLLADDVLVSIKSVIGSSEDYVVLVEALSANPYSFDKTFPYASAEFPTLEFKIYNSDGSKPAA